MTAIGVAWIPIVQNFSELFHYIQSVSSFFAPPICAVYLLAVLWRRTNEQVRVQSRHLATLKLLLSVGVSYKCFLHFPFSACNSLSLGSHTSSFYLFISVLSLSIIFTHKSSVFFQFLREASSHVDVSAYTWLYLLFVSAIVLLNFFMCGYLFFFCLFVLACQYTSAFIILAGLMKLFLLLFSLCFRLRTNEVTLP